MSHPASLAIDLDSNRFHGVANVVGTMDRGGDVVAPGAFRAALPMFLQTGFIALSHAWDALPVAMPVAAEERAGGLWIAATFHTTDAGQAARTVVRERLAHGLQVGLSIGFRAEAKECLGFRTGADLLEHARRRGMSHLDEAGIAAWKAPCRLVGQVAELFEVSIVAVPMNSGSKVLASKSRE